MNKYQRYFLYLVGCFVGKLHPDGKGFWIFSPIVYSLARACFLIKYADSHYPEFLYQLDDWGNIVLDIRRDYIYEKILEDDKNDFAS